MTLHGDTCLLGKFSGEIKLSEQNQSYYLSRLLAQHKGLDSKGTCTIADDVVGDRIVTPRNIDSNANLVAGNDVVQIILALGYVADADGCLMDILLCQEGFRMGLNIGRITDGAGCHAARFIGGDQSRLLDVQALANFNRPKNQCDEHRQNDGQFNGGDTVSN